jgi:FAD synthase
MSENKPKITIKRKPLPSVSIPKEGSPLVVTTPAATPFSGETLRSPLVQSPSSITTYATSSYDSSILDAYIDNDTDRINSLQIRSRPATSPAPVDSNYQEARPGPSLVQPLDQLDVKSRLTTPKLSKSLPLVADEKIRSAYGEVRHFAGGLVSHPHESTSHYSILRHSHGLVYYSGSFTNIAITVFADRELPADRTFWLQRKGWSGKTGMRAGALFGTHGAWIDVTPSVTAAGNQVKPADERAWQRDMNRFLRKAPKKLSQHQPRETNVLRIPCDADDGYLRVMMCAGQKGKKVLCPSPVFRLASTSMDSSSVRGASLRTLPIEAALKIGTFVATKAANTVAAPYIEMARTFVTSQMTSVYQPSMVTQTAMTTAYDQSGITGRVESLNEQYEAAREQSFEAMNDDVSGPAIRALIIGDESGPQSPYPVRFHGRVVAGTGESMNTTGFPTANVKDVDSNVVLRHNGLYFGWASVSLPKKLQEELLVDDDWHEAIISIVPNPNKRANVVQKKMIRVYIIEDFEGVKFFDVKISIIMMAYLRPPPQLAHGQTQESEARISELLQDIATASASLARPAWKVDETLERIRSAASGRSFSQRYIDMRQTTQKQIDRVPTWRLGVRSDGAALKDAFVGNGGLTIRR